ncbi:hypothetical protein E2I00_014110, partial [Balaenoptera physalus]
TEPKSVIFLHPPWTTVFQGENVTLTCKTIHFDASEKIKWYHQYLLGEIQSETSGNTHEVYESGDYRCQAQDSLLSNRVSLLFSPANLILQAPLDVFEKESVILRCRAKANTVLNTIKLYKNGKVLEVFEKSSDFHIHQASLKDNGKYHCVGVKEDDRLVSSNSVKIEVQELFPSPVLRASSTQPTEEGAVTLTCETQLPPQRPDVQLQFHFFRDRQSLGSGWRSSPEFRIPTIWREDSGSYWCQAQSMTPSVQKQSQRLHIQVKNVVPDVRIYPRPKLVFEGQELVLICSVNGLPGPITISWYRKFKKPRTERKLHTYSKTEFKIPVVKNSHDGEYYCVASNSRSSFRSDPVTINFQMTHPFTTLRAPRAQDVGKNEIEFQIFPNILGVTPMLRQWPGDPGSEERPLSIRIPVSQPVLTLNPPGTRTLVGDEVSFDCEAQRGSLPIWYQFFREGVLLMKIETTLWRTTSYRFSLTAEHSGNYYCTADNGLGPQSSETLRLSVTGKPWIPASDPPLTQILSHQPLQRSAWIFQFPTPLNLMPVLAPFS